MGFPVSDPIMAALRPSDGELSGFSTVTDVIEWAEMPAVARTSFFNVLGQPPDLRVRGIGHNASYKQSRSCAPLNPSTVDTFARPYTPTRFCRHWRWRETAYAWKKLVEWWLKTDKWRWDWTSL